MRRAIVIVIAVAAGIAVGFFWPKSAADPDRPALTPADNAPLAERTSKAPPRTARVAPPTMTPPGGNAEQIALQQRAMAGDGAAALQWMDLNRACRYVERFSAIVLVEYFDDESEPPERPRFAQISAEEHAYLADRSIDAAQRQTRARAIEARLHASCNGYRASNDAERYAIAQIAAQHGPPEGLRRFIAEPPFFEDLSMNQGGNAEQLAHMRDWSSRVPAMLSERAGRGDADAALALGLAYALDADDEPAGLDAYFLLNGALDNDAAQSYRWLSRYLQLAPDGAHAAFARAALVQLAGRLDPSERAALERELGTAITKSTSQ
ncbi:hypothetical protein [Tahibacter sp.]|uniref:hypothetical protein n=1 Tax=Tahibacter sp. TaxID=2056211 RepID=UPI0028C40D0B|nr:hypothetical protein [Tahibacter sp.]